MSSLSYFSRALDVLVHGRHLGKVDFVNGDFRGKAGRISKVTFGHPAGSPPAELS